MTVNRGRLTLNLGIRDDDLFDPRQGAQGGSLDRLLLAAKEDQENATDLLGDAFHTRRASLLHEGV